MEFSLYKILKKYNFNIKYLSGLIGINHKTLLNKLKSNSNQYLTTYENMVLYMTIKDYLESFNKDMKNWFQAHVNMFYHQSEISYQKRKARMKKINQTVKVLSVRPSDDNLERNSQVHGLERFLAAPVLPVVGHLERENLRGGARRTPRGQLFLHGLHPGR